MRIVDRDQQGSRRREIGRQPVQAVQHRERPVRRRRDTAEEERAHSGGGAGNEGLALRGLRIRKAPLEELPHDTEGELHLELGSACAQNAVAELLRAPACNLHQRRLSEPCPTLDQEDAGPALEQRLDLGQLGLTLEQSHRNQETASAERRTSSSTTAPCAIARRRSEHLTPVLRQPQHQAVVIATSARLELASRARLVAQAPGLRRSR